MANSANFESSIIIRAGVEGISDLNQLIDVIEQAGGDVSHLRTQAEQLSNTWNALSTEEQNRQLQELGQSAQGLARQTNTATASMERMFNARTDNSINAEIAQVNASLNTLNQRYNAGTISQNEFNRLIQSGQTRLNALQAELNQTAQSVNRMDNATNQASGSMSNLGGAFGKFQGLLATLGVGIGVTELVQLADSFNNLESRVKLATGGGQEFITAMQGVQQVANATFTDLNSTATLFSKLSANSKELGMSQQELLGLTETINQAMKVSGATTEEASSAILQFSQGLASGVVRGDEFNSIMENGGRLADAMAKGLGVTKGELRKMAEEGKLTAKTVVEAIKSQKDAIATDFGGMTVTVSDSIQTLKNNVLSLVGDIDNQLNQSSGLATFIQDFADGLKNIDPTTVDAVKEAFSQLGILAKELYSGVMTLGDGIGGVWSAFDGSTASGEKVSLLTKIVQELSLFIGHVSDGVKAMQIVSDGVFGAMIIGIGGVLSAWESLTGKSHEASDRLMKQGDELLQRANKNALEFESSAVKASENFKNSMQKSMEGTAEQAEQASKKSIEAFDKLAKSAKTSGEELATGFNDAVSKATTPEQIETLITKYNDLAKQGSITGQQLADGINQATPRIAELEKTVGRQVLSMAELGKVGADTAQNIKDKMADTATTLGLDFEKASNKTSDAFTKTAGAVLNIGQNFDQLKKEGYDATLLIEQGLTKMQATAKNKADFDLLNATITKMGKEGKLSGDQVTQALENSKKKAKELEIGVSDVEKAYAKLGLKSQAELQKQAQENKQAFDIINKDTTASLQIRQQAFEKYAQSQVDANKGVVSSELQVQATALGYSSIVSENGKVSLQTAEQIAQANAKVAQSNQQVGVTIDANTEKLKQQAEQATKEADAKAKYMQATGGGVAGAMLRSMNHFRDLIKSNLEEIGATSEQVSKIYQRNMQDVQAFGAMVIGDKQGFTTFFANMGLMEAYVKKNLDAFNAARNKAIEMTNALGDASVTTNTLTQAQRALEEATKANVNGIVKMDEQTLSNLKKAIDDTKHKMDDLADSAKDTADNLEAELARMDGDDSLARKLEQTRKLEEAQNKLNEARQRGNQAEIEQYQRALELQKKINDKENQQAQQKAEETKRKEAETAQKSQAKSDTATTQTTVPATQTTQPVVTTSYADYLAQPVSNVTANEVVSELMKKSVEIGKQAMFSQMMEEAKRLPR